MTEKIAVIGLGYVGLPLALALSRKFPKLVGFDLDARKISRLQKGQDSTGEVARESFASAPIQFSHTPEELADRSFFIVAVPTPVDAQKRPDLGPVCKASELVGKALRRGAVVVFESTVYPGVTEDICGPILERASGLKRGVDFKLGYSPERINPGDKEHTLERITKIVSGEDAETLERVAKVYGAVVTAGVYRATSIKVAEAAKVIENTQRDLNIALMNELALIFDRMGIRTNDVLTAAGTKWNFLPFRPGLVGGHCIGVDPYYLTSKAEELGYRPQVILAGRRINDDMGKFIAQKTIKLLSTTEVAAKGARVGILGLAFKENVSDIRNSRVPDIVSELREFGVNPLVADCLADPEETLAEYNIHLAPLSEFRELDAVVLAVPHVAYVKNSSSGIMAMLKSKGVLLDIKAALNPATLPPGIIYWSL